MKTIAVVIALAISGIVVTGGANASRMNGKGGWCSEGSNCMSARAKAAMSPKKPHMAKPKTGST
jgi:hypothetical protein